VWGAGEKTREKMLLTEDSQILQYHSLRNTSRKELPPSQPAAEAISLYDH